LAILFDANQSSQVDRVVALLKSGVPVGLPTETVYGLAAPATQELALAKIFQLKARPYFDPLIVHVLNSSWVSSLVDEITPVHKKLMQAFWPGPLSILFKKNKQIPDLCTSDSPWVALRSPAHPVFQTVLQKLSQPLAAPSANRFSRISPTCAADVIEELGPYGLEAVLEGGSCTAGIESTIIRVLPDNKIEVLRPGATPLESLAETLGPDYEIFSAQALKSEKIQAPGQMDTHYAPRTPLVFFKYEEKLKEYLLSQSSSEFTARTTFLTVYPSQIAKNYSWKQVVTLSDKSSESEACSQLFRILRDLDRGQNSQIVALGLAQPKGLELAINDRLFRAGRSTK